MRLIDLTGQVFGRLTVLKMATPPRVYWECKCICGKVKKVETSKLRYGETQSCGCFQKERQRVSGRGTRTHGQAVQVTQAYKAWQSMKTRCLNPESRLYAGYGGRGITVCERWMEFEPFFADMGTPEKGMSLDRIDNNGPYSPQNCRWATRSQQQRNKRSTLLLTYQERTAPLAQWADEYGLPREILHARIKLSWDVERALTQPYIRRAVSSRNIKKESTHAGSGDGLPSLF